MKVLHYVDEKNLAWGETWIQLLKELAANGIENHVVCGGWGTLTQRLRDADIPFDTCRPITQILPITNLKLGTIINKITPDIIHTRLSSAARIGGWWGKRKKIPVLQTIDKFPKLKYHVDGTFFAACSSSVKDYFLNIGGCANKVTVIHNPIDTSMYSCDSVVRRETRSSLFVSDDIKIVLAAGRFVEWKGFDVLIKSYENLLGGGHGANSMLWIVGDGEEKNILKKMVSDSPFKEKIKIFPFASDIKPYMCAADLFVLPSKEPEPFGIVLLEAMASSLPVIATKVGGPLDILSEGSGWLVAPNDVNSLSSCMAAALSNSLSLAETGRKARKRAEYFSLGRIAAETICVYQKMIQR
ncbi:glycosyltransferase family 4 protein [Cloacibacillus evryensis]|uniref:glycosyltransferase family 4 protein n=1 Tax=Cloacibacillus evryensis TaxID=508460 RepID=UPI002670E7CB|nr:glycosyltransferase family 4 protein [Cloacibacillus evryensis]